MKINTNKTLEFAKNLSLKVGDVLVKKQKKIASLKITVKEAQGVASSADYLAEKMIIKEIKKEFPGHFILAEESAFKEFQGEKSRLLFLKEKEWVWVIDPLDGTHNYLNGLDYYAICISLIHYGEPVVGVVYRPSSDDCFFALKGKGAFVQKLRANKRPIRMGEKKIDRPLKNCLLVTGFTSEKGEMFDQEFALFKLMLGKSRGIRRMGSAALDICYVASGLFDLFWERGLAPWDISAAGLICLEAKIKVVDYQGRDFHPFQETILATRPSLYEEVLKLFRKSL